MLFLIKLLAPSDECYLNHILLSCLPNSDFSDFIFLHLLVVFAL